MLENIYNLLVRALETGRKASHKRDFLTCFAASANELHVYYFPTMYEYWIYPAISKSTKQLTNCLKIAVTSVVLIVLFFIDVLC